MRNLKKFLALVLAVMMTLSLMVTANAAIDTDAAVTDKDSVTEEFKEAVAVLNGLKIITGYQDGSFQPQKTISRQETTALIYRLHSGDVDNTRNNLYSTVDNIKQFTDVDPNGGQQWSAGYIGYCANQGIIRGVSDTRFAPTHEVTGYQVLAMVLRAIGYGQNKEYEGTGWQTRVATTATKIGILKNINNTNYAGTLSAPATRELVAEIIFQAAIQPTVTYTPALGYIYETGIQTVGAGGTLAYKNFNLRISSWTSVDEWGRPGYYWFQNTRSDGKYVASGSGKNVVATITPVATKEYTDLQRECDVAHDLEIESSETFSLFVNSKTALTDSYKIMATDTVTKVGGQGRLTEIYYDYSRPWNNTDNGAIVPGSSSGADTVVMVDTMLAYVNGKSDAVLDKADHIITPAKLDVTIYDGNVKTSDAAANGATNVYSNRTISKPNTSKDNWDEYSVGDYILIYAYTDQSEPNVHATSDAMEKAAFETNKVVDRTTGYSNNTLVQGTNVWVQKKADVKQGKQTVTYWNQGKHQVDGQDYPDQLTLFLDKAGNNVNTTYNWYFDLYGNIIGIAEATGSRYGVITSIYAAVSQGESDTTGGIKAMANVKFSDGTTGTVAIDKFLVSNYEDHTVSNDKTSEPYKGISTNWVDFPLSAAVRTSGDHYAGTAELRPRYDTVNNLPLTANKADPTFSSDLAYKTGFLYLAPSTIANNDAHFSSYADRDQYGILYKNLFEFVTASDESVIAVEVAGTAKNTDLYAGNRNRAMDGDTSEGRLVKSLGILSLNYNSATQYTSTRLDSNTQIIVRSGSTALDEAQTSWDHEVRAGTFNTYTLATLPGDVELDRSTEVDWVDENGDGIAEVVYVMGSVPGALTYGLFYYNGGAAQWNGTTGTIEGYLNGKATTVTFNNEDQFRTVQNSSGYAGHLFALQMANNVVNNVMLGYNSHSSNGDSDVGPELLYDHRTGGNNTNETTLEFYVAGVQGAGNIRTVFGAGYTAFQLGTLNGNPYTETTKAIYYHDTAGNAGTADHTAGKTNLTYNQSTRTITVSNNNSKNDVYWLAADVTVVGELEWLNTRECDVTMIYDDSKANAKVAVEVYITPDPDWTPSNPAGAGIGGVNAVLNEAATPAALGATLMGGGRNMVVFNPFTKIMPGTSGTNYDGLASTCDPDKLLYFPYVSDDAGVNTVEIRLADTNVLVYSESNSSSVGAGAHCFVVDITDATNVAGATRPGMPLRTGVNYRFNVIGVGNTVLSTGTFYLS